MTQRLVCLGCGFRSKIRVVYGLPGPDLFEKARQGELAFGGCNPEKPPGPWLCDACEQDESKRRLLATARARSSRS